MKNTRKEFVDPEGITPISCTVQHRVSFSEVDPMQIVWHGNYIRFFEKALEKMVAQIGMSFKDLKAQQLLLLVAKLDIDYRYPIRLYENISINAKLHWSEGARLNIELTITNDQERVVCRAAMFLLIAHIDTLEPLLFSPDIWENCKQRWRNGEFSHVS